MDYGSWENYNAAVVGWSDEAEEEISRLSAEVRRLRLVIEAHQVQSAGWRPTTEVDRELWAHGANEWSEVEPPEPSGGSRRVRRWRQQ